MVLPKEEKCLRLFYLIEEDRWNLRRIEHRTSVVEKKTILKLSLPMGRGNDRLLWINNKDEIYSVKSRYRVAKLEENAVVNLKPSSSYNVPRQFWKCLWKV